VVAAAFNEHVVRATDEIDCTSPWAYGGRNLNDAHPHNGPRTVMDILKKSSNVGTAKIALMLGDERLERYYRDFGLGQRTGIDLPYEDGGIFHPRDRDCAFCGHDKQGRPRCHGWSALTPTRISIGQGIALTAIQVVGAVNTIANDGLRMQPILVRRVTNPDGTEVERNQPTVVKRVLDLESARLTARLMARITEQGGTGWRAAIPGVAVAGKTGTAQKPVPGGYSKTDYVASFVGFLPAENPRFTLLVTLDNPKGRAGHQGGQVAAPVFRQIAEEAIRYLDIPTNSVPRQVEI
jgi:cell division protein FtsI (penicillin-binding protein 3)